MNKRAEDLALAISKIAEAYDPTFGLPIYPEVVPNHAEPRRQILALIDAELRKERERCAERAQKCKKKYGTPVGSPSEHGWNMAIEVAIAAILKEEP